MGATQQDIHSKVHSKRHNEQQLTVQQKYSSFILDNFEEVQLKRGNITSLVPEDNIVPFNPNKVTKSSKRKTGYALVEVSTTEVVHGPLEVIQPRFVCPRQAAFSCPELGHCIRDRTPEVKMVDGVRSAATKGANIFGKAPIIHQENLRGQSVESSNP
ncbi:Diadenosine tetraphosphate synthetase [Psidium guajava]|nr:Diadenosine tetraphosphate synthetase [Psidium guajava]